MIFVAPFNAAVAAVATAISLIATWWGDGTSYVKLMKNNPTIDSNTAVGTFVEADFTGYTEYNTGGAPTILTDPLTGELVLHFNGIDQGYIFITGDAVGLPMTIYGAYLVDDTRTKLLGAVKFANPIILTAANQYIELADLRFPVSTVPLGS